MPEIKIFDALPEEEILAQMSANSSTRFSKASFSDTGVGFTPQRTRRSFRAALDASTHSSAIYLCSIVFFGGELDDNDPCNMCDAVGDRMVEIMEQKLARWKYRLMKKEDVDVPEE